MAFVAFFQLVFYRQFDPQVISGLTEGPQLEALRQTLSAYWGSNWYEHLWGSLERLSVLSIHLSATVLVYYAITNALPVVLVAVSVADVVPSALAEAMFTTLPESRSAWVMA